MDPTWQTGSHQDVRGNDPNSQMHVQDSFRHYKCAHKCPNGVHEMMTGLTAARKGDMAAQATVTL